MSDPINVTWKWLVGTLAVIILLVIGTWATTIQGQVSDANKNSASQAIDIAVIKEQLRVILDELKDQREARKETDKKLNELRDIIQGQKRP